MKRHEDSTEKIAVIGAGLGGLAVAARLAGKGYEVHVFESSNEPGGKAVKLGNGDFTFDAGPSLFTMPDWVDEVFYACGKNPRDYYHYHRLDSLCRYFYEDGTRIHARSDKTSFANELASKTSDTADSVLKFLKKSARIYELTEQVFIRKSLHRLGTYLSAATVKGIVNFGDIDAFSTMEESIRHFFSDEKNVQLFCRYATFNGSNPYLAPGTLNVIPHLEYHFGAYLPENGIYDITQALYKLCLDTGVKFHFSTPVERILVEGKVVKGILANSQNLPFSRVVSNADVYFTYRRLMPDQPAPDKKLAQERSSSAFIFYWGMDTSFPELGLHNIFFSEDYKQEFKSLFDDLAIPGDPTVYVNITSKECIGHAPEGSENWFVMVNAPHHTGQDWQQLQPGIKQRIIAKLENLLQRPVAPHIRFEQVLTPESIESKTGSYLGSLYGTSSNSRFAAFARHSNFSGIKGLYFCGGSVHPGGGIPMVMNSAKIVSEEF